MDFIEMLMLIHNLCVFEYASVHDPLAHSQLQDYNVEVGDIDELLPVLPKDVLTSQWPPAAQRIQDVVVWHVATLLVDGQRRVNSLLKIYTTTLSKDVRQLNSKASVALAY